MKKIMFNDKYGLTQAVLDGRKTMTRRIIHAENIPDDPEYGYAPNIDACCVFNEDDVVAKSQYNLGDVVAIAQCYYNVYGHETCISERGEKDSGIFNKMFVRAESMPHHIKITSVRVERLQDISDEDCLREGIYLLQEELGKPSTYTFSDDYLYMNPRSAFKALIDKVSGKGTWDSNPMVWVYEFELVD